MNVKMQSHPIPIKREVCHCGQVHTVIPADARFSDTGFYWNCVCGTTKNAIFKLKNKAPEGEEEFGESKAVFVGGCV